MIEYPRFLSSDVELFRRKRSKRTVIVPENMEEGQIAWFRGITGDDKPKAYRWVSQLNDDSIGYWTLVGPKKNKHRTPCPHDRARVCMSPADVGHGQPFVPEDGGLHTTFPHPKD